MQILNIHLISFQKKFTYVEKVDNNKFACNKLLKSGSKEELFYSFNFIISKKFKKLILRQILISNFVILNCLSIDY